MGLGVLMFFMAFVPKMKNLYFKIYYFSSNCWLITAFVPLSSSAILREEVKYVHTDTDLMIMEKAARGRQDIVLGYVLSLGTRGMEWDEREQRKEIVG